jgi:hypothetical protein
VSAEGERLAVLRDELADLLVFKLGVARHAGSLSLRLGSDGDDGTGSVETAHNLSGHHPRRDGDHDAFDVIARLDQPNAGHREGGMPAHLACEWSTERAARHVLSAQWSAPCGVILVLGQVCAVLAVAVGSGARVRVIVELHGHPSCTTS